MDPFEAYQNAYDEARRADLDKKFRVATDKYWKAIRLAPDGVWTKYRLYFLDCYVHYLGTNIMPAKKDYKNLETHLVNNEDDPNIFRAKAAFCLGFMYVIDKKNYEESAECFRHCIDLCDSASPEEKERVDEYVILMMADEPPRARQLSEVFDELKENALKGLRQMETGAQRAVGLPDPVRAPWRVHSRSELVPIFGDIPTELMERRMASGGATCDCCGVARESTDLKRLLVCGKCNMAYYCSKECQVEQWKRGGHKMACRRPREFHAGDIVRYLWEDKAAVLQLNRLVDGETGDAAPKWEAYCGTRIDGDPFLLVVEESELRHIRPADIV